MARMTQDALHPAEMKGKPHQSQKAIKASRKKKAGQMKTAKDTKAKATAKEPNLPPNPTLPSILFKLKTNLCSKV